VNPFIVIETFDNNVEFYINVKGEDLCAKTKEELIQILNEDNGVPSVSIGVYYTKLMGFTISKMKDAIIKLVDNIDGTFKWIRIYYENIELSELDKKKFETFKREGFPEF